MRTKPAPAAESAADFCDTLAAARRFIRAVGRHVAAGDPADLRHLVALRVEAELAERAAVAGLKSTGATWEEIGGALGITRQAALMRFSDALTGPIRRALGELP